MISSWIPVRFRRLRWKLTFSYTLVTVAAFLTLGVTAVFLAVLTNQSSGWLDYYQSLAVELAADARPFLEAAPSDSTSLEVAISSEDWTVVVSPARELLAANPQVADDEISIRQPFVDPYAPEESRQLISQALGGEPGIIGHPDGTILTVAPILGAEKEVLGVLYMRGFSDTLIPGSILRGGLLILGVSAIVITFAAGLIGALFGRITSRGLVSRLENLNSATQAWGQGDFSTSVQDSSADEIGQLSRRMNLMSEQIQDLLRVRQELAALQERNRLARDLHDSVKQQVFATTMTLGTAKSWRERDPETAWGKVDEALDLSWQAQQELTGLIQELRPLALEGRGLAAALRDYAASWSQQTGIEVSLDLHSEQAIPPQVEAALFRVSQEALVNVSKHSGAGSVKVSLVSTDSAIDLEVIDDGSGFDLESTAGIGMGLRSMRERIEALGGELTVESTPGTGTRLLACLESE